MAAKEQEQEGGDDNDGNNDNGDGVNNESRRTSKLADKLDQRSEIAKDHSVCIHPHAPVLVQDQQPGHVRLFLGACAGVGSHMSVQCATK